MSQTNRYSLPYILPAQAQKHVTHNEALTKLDALVNLGVKMIASSLPDTPLDGEAFILSQSPETEWEAHANNVAIFIEGGWHFFTPVMGWMTWVEQSTSIWVYTGQNWENLQGLAGIDFDPALLSQQSTLGINAQADSFNRFSLNSQASLFNHEGAGHRLAINKNTPEDTASFVLQTGFSGRAEIGLTGNDDLSLRQSADGTQWANIMSWPAGTGLTQFHGLDLGNLSLAAPELSGAIAYIHTGLEFPQFVYCDGTIWRKLIDGSPAIMAASALNPLAAGTNVVLSNNNRDMTNATTGNWASVKGEKSHNTGLFYFEAEIISISSATSSLIGVADETTQSAAGLSTFPGSFANSAAIRPDRIFYRGMSLNEPSTPYFGQLNDRIMVAVDIDNGRVWFGQNGAWLNSEARVPSAEGENFNISVTPATTLYPALSSAHPENIIRLHTGAADLAYTPPAGFNAWG